MKKILTFLMPAVISFSSVPALANVITTNNSVKSEEAILTLNFSEKRSFEYSSEVKNGKVNDGIISYDLAPIMTNWNEFVAKYPKFTFSNTTVKMDAYLDKKEDDLSRPFNTKDLSLPNGYDLSTLKFDGFNAKFDLSFSAYVDANSKKLLLAGNYVVQNGVSQIAVFSYDVHFEQIVFFS
ncbi:hypothetical protein [Spiroplasma chrysopicola]|uniref:Uncharacterized protein n=1 Tax=Spiroplasma chrysopicola DF-1 TaxID=1276227 RepID=R4U447_9MOLU|nr:hypothetical protein [Spiroplasma chrysopicola]AGM25328.1 hypothetical protein SCHRY_v1c07520 [Spiroplasma chrysopicola DF-1]